MNKYVQTWRNVCRLHKLRQDVQCSCSGWSTGNGKKLSNCQACCLAQQCLAAAELLSISCGANYLRALHCIQAVKLQSKKIAIFHGALNEKQCEIHQLQSIVFLFTYVPIREFDKINYVTLYGLLHWI